jgi:hypothetical protein
MEGLPLKAFQNQRATLIAGLRAIAYLFGTVAVVFYLVMSLSKIRILPTLVIILLGLAGMVCFVVASYMEMADSTNKKTRGKKDDGEA